ncbi:hypothetical protein E4634_12170 [Mangrovimicrobium sediminis]|uniref:Carbohydrate porin n=1 Tax=Mangrovimicrobium sediminis TaxID=2562682 RepID=A0A4Z0M174_9GAMM|nr:hypothetical protein E4634_12170 [Haliea sp. SAOS-164]
MLPSTTPRLRPARPYVILCLALLGAALTSPASLAADVGTLEADVAELERQLTQARARLAAAREAERAGAASAGQAQELTGQAQAIADQDTAALEPTGLETTGSEPSANDDKIRFGPLTIGGAMRVNYVNGDYSGSGDGPRRGGNGGNVELDTFRINASLDYGKLNGKLEYRWYNGYNFLHTLWLGYGFDSGDQLQAGVTRVPFGPGPYGISQSWFFDQHYYLGLSDDMDLGLKYLTRRGPWELALAWFPSSEGNWNGNSADSARYSYDAVRWRSAIDPNGDVVAAPENGYSERNQFNLRAIYHLEDVAIPTAAGLSLQAGQLDGKRADDGEHWAASVHMINHIGQLTLASQLTRYQYDIDADNPLGTDELLPMGAYDFAWPVAADAWVPALSVSYKLDTPRLGWLDYALPYIEYSSIVKDIDRANDSQMLTLGMAFASGGWYVYTDYVRATGNLFIGNRGDDYSNIYDGVGDFGITGNDRWNDRFNINFGYYF